MDYAALKAEIAMPAYAKMTDAEIGAALVAPIQVSDQSFRWGDAVDVTRRSKNFSWARILQRSQGTATLPPASGQDVAILEAKNAVDMPVDQDVSSASWPVVQQGMAGLLAEGDLTQADIDAITALTVRTTTLAAQIGCPELAQIDVESAVYHIKTARAS